MLKGEEKQKKVKRAKITENLYIKLTKEEF
jgi:hypothetical protein